MLLGIEIGGTKLQIFTGTRSGEIRERYRFDVDAKSGAGGIRSAIETKVRTLTSTGAFEAIGVGFGGPVDAGTGTICCSHQVDGWGDFGFAKWLQSIARVPVFVENDANVASLGEACCGAGSKARTVFYITMGSGVGGGVTQNQKIYHGALPGESEFGHLRLDKSGVIVEQRCSGWAVDKAIRKALRESKETVLKELCEGMKIGEARMLGRALEGRDAVAKGILAQVTDDLAFALSHVVHLIHPDVIVLGGGLSLLGNWLRDGVHQKLPTYVMEAFHPVPSVEIALLGEDAVPVGALLLAGQKLGSTG